MDCRGEAAAVALTWPGHDPSEDEGGGGTSGGTPGADRAPPSAACGAAPRPSRPGAALRRERTHRPDLRGHRAGRGDPGGRHPGRPVAGRARVVGVRRLLPQRRPHRGGLLGLPPATGLLLDDPRHGPRRTGARPSPLARGRRRLLRHRAADARPGPDRLGAAGHEPHPDADRDGHGRRCVPAVRDRPRPRRSDPTSPWPLRWSLVFLLLSARPTLGRWVPPIIGALVVGAIAVALSGRFDPGPRRRTVDRRPGAAGPAVVGAGDGRAGRPAWRSPCSSCRTGRGSPCSRAAGHDAPVERDHHRVRRRGRCWPPAWGPCRPA